MWADLDVFENGTLDRAYEYLGCHKTTDGFVFRVWAPHASSVQVLGAWNDWSFTASAMHLLCGGIWELNCPEARAGDAYQYRIQCADGRFLIKTDPYGQAMGSEPKAASRVYAPSDFPWTDSEWMQSDRDPLHIPINIYEAHAGSWNRTPEGGFLTYRELADRLVRYLRSMKYTHLELLPLAEHPYFPSWGYEITGFFAPTSRYGEPEGLKYLVDRAHNAGIGVILDWVGAHFPKDETGLACFDGSYLYEASEEELREHSLWNTHAFDFEKPQVRSFLLSNALYWLREFHFDGLRVDAVSSVIYRDDTSQQWLGPMAENLNHAAIDFLQTLNRACFAWRRDILMFAEESTTFPLVTKPDYDGGLGFNYKWGLGWMHDVLDYMALPPEQRSARHELLTFSMTYAFSENFLLPLSHDEVVHGKHSLLGRMPGSYEQKFAGLRVLYAFMMAHPGKKLLFMGGEFGQFIEWDQDRPLDWFLLQYKPHKKLQRFVKDLNRLYQSRPALWEQDGGWEGFHWLIPDDAGQSVLAFERRGKEDLLLLVCNFSCREYEDYRIGVPLSGKYSVCLCSDAACYGGRGAAVPTRPSEPVPMHGYAQSISLNLPPLCAIYFEHFQEEQKPMLHGPEKQWVAMVLAGGQGSRLGALTCQFAKPALSFGGKYRIIDFVLTNCAASGIDTVGVLTQYQPLLLNEYVAAGQSWDLCRNYGGVQLLPPYTSVNSQQWYLGTADAIYQNTPFLDRYRPSYVLVLSADHIYTMDYTALLRQHRRTGAVCTIAVREVSRGEAQRMGVLQTDERGRVVSFQEKPEHPASTLVSMGIYLFDWAHLRMALGRDAAAPASTHDFGQDVIPALLSRGEPVYACPFEGYWRDVGTPESLWQTNMDLLSDPPQWAWPILTHPADRPPSLIEPGASVIRSIVADGCRIAGKVTSSVLSAACQVGPDAIITDSVLMPGAVICAGARVSHAILGEGCQIGPEAKIGLPEPEAGLCLIGHGQVVSGGDCIMPKANGTGGGL